MCELSESPWRLNRVETETMYSKHLNLKCISFCWTDNALSNFYLLFFILFIKNTRLAVFMKYNFKSVLAKKRLDTKLISVSEKKTINIPTLANMLRLIKLRYI